MMKTKYSISLIVLLLTAITIMTNTTRVKATENHTVYLPLINKNYSPPAYLKTGITNIDQFLDICPTNDPEFDIFSNEFKILKDGIRVKDFHCTEPFSELSIDLLTDELIALQVIRTIYYMDSGIPDTLPWTTMSLYDWMVDNIGGINLVSAPNQYWCCQEIAGNKYFIQSVQTDDQRNYKRDWMGISGSISFYTHEIRHADGGPNHVTGCVTFPSGVLGCDQDYDVSNLGSYGVQYWLDFNWMYGLLNVGISCNPETSLDYIQWHLISLNTLRDRFVDNIPPLLSMPSPPYGGPCYTP